MKTTDAVKKAPLDKKAKGKAPPTRKSPRTVKGRKRKTTTVDEGALAVMCKLGEAGEVVVVPTSIPALQGVIDGFVTVLALDNFTVAVLDEDAMLKGKPVNRSLPTLHGYVPVYGTAVILGRDPRTKDFVSLTEAQAAFWATALS